MCRPLNQSSPVHVVQHTFVRSAARQSNASELFQASGNACTLRTSRTRLTRLCVQRPCHRKFQTCIAAQMHGKAPLRHAWSRGTATVSAGGRKTRAGCATDQASLTSSECLGVARCPP